MRGQTGRTLVSQALKDEGKLLKRPFLLRAQGSGCGFSESLCQNNGGRTNRQFAISFRPAKTAPTGQT